MFTDFLSIPNAVSLFVASAFAVNTRNTELDGIFKSFLAQAMQPGLWHENGCEICAYPACLQCHDCLDCLMTANADYQLCLWLEILLLISQHMQ